MKKPAGIFLRIFLVCAIAVSSYAQVPYFQFYSLLKRNESLQVNVVFQDKSGFIWCGTNKGLFRYDGISQQRFTNLDSLPDDNVTAIAQDSLGRIWTGHKNGRIAFMDKGTIQIFDPPEGSSTHEISDILFDRHGNLWFSTLNDGLYYFTHERLFRVDEEEGMPDIFVYDIVEDRLGNIWAGTDGGVAICTLLDRKVNIKVLDYDHGLPDNIVKKIIIDERNTVWLGTEDAGIFSFDPGSGKTSPLLGGAWKYGATTDFLLDEDQVWIASSQSGLIVYDLKTEQGKVYKANAEFDFNSIRTLLRDLEGNIWIGSRSGIARTLGDHVEYISSFDPYTDVNVLTLTVDHDDNIWFATADGLFKRMVDELGKIHIERMLMNTPFQKYTAISLYTDNDGYLWVGFYGEGILRINPSSGKIVDLDEELSNGNILSITGRENIVWLATLGGATKISTSGEQLAIRNYSRADGLVSDYIYQVFIDSQQRVWFATDGKEAAMLDDTGFHHYDKGLSSNVVYGFAEDKLHNIWVNVQGDGIYRFDGEMFQPLGKDTPLRDKNVNCFSSDQFGNLIAMHDLGIDIYDIEKNQMRYLGEEVGMHARKPNLNALTKDVRGRIYIGTDQGIVKYADQMNNMPPLPQPFIAGLKVSGQNVDLSQELKFAYDQNSVIINYLGFWFQNPRNLNFQYRLENYDKDWIESLDRSTTYSNLPPGDYTFLLRVSDTEDFSAAKETAVHFVIQPPFWQTLWFYFLVAFTVIYSTYAYIKYSRRKLLRDNIILEEKVIERTLEIQEQAKEIQTKNAEIQSQAEEIQGINDNLELIVKSRTAELEKKTKASEESAFIIAHELRAPVASVLGLINLISKCNVDDETKTIVKHMEDSAEKLNVVVRNITKAIEKGDK